MSKILTSTITVDFSSQEAEQRLLIEADDRARYSLRTQYLRVYPERTGDVWESSGELVRRGNAVREVDEILAFNNSKEVSLSYPEGYTVHIALLGSYHDLEGRRITPHLEYNRATNSITSTAVGFGVIKVTYKSNYTLYKFLYEGWGCPYEPDYSGPPSGTSLYTPFGSTVEEYIPYEDAIVVVYEAATGDYATITLKAPKCEYGLANISRDSGVGNLIVEVDVDGPVAIATYPDNGMPSTGALEASALVRVYPDVAVEIIASEGTLYNPEVNKSATITEPITFKGVNGVNVKYPPNGRIGIEVDSAGIYDQWNRLTSVLFRQEGYTVKEVNWTGVEQYDGEPQDRIVQPGEIVATDSQGRVIKISGLIHVTYATTYRLYPYGFDTDTTSTGIVVKYKDAIITATYHKPPHLINRKQAGTLRLKGPTIKGADAYAAPD